MLNGNLSSDSLLQSTSSSNVLRVMSSWFVIRTILLIPIVVFFVSLALTRLFEVSAHGPSSCKVYEWQGLISNLVSDQEAFEIAKHCIEKHNRDVNERGGPFRATTALHMASGFGHARTVYYLIAKGAVVSIPDEAGWTPLHYATAGGRTQVCEILAMEGADLYAKNGRGRTPEEVAHQRGNAECGRILLQLMSRR